MHIDVVSWVQAAWQDSSAQPLLSWSPFLYFCAVQQVKTLITDHLLPHAGAFV